MPYLRDGRALIDRAFRGGFAMPAFNVCTLAMARACIEAAEAEAAPIILQTYPGDLEHADASVFAAMVRALAERSPVEIVLHLDHGDSRARAESCLRAGYGSVMFDGAALALDDNVRATREVAEVAHTAGAACEGAAGTFGGEADGDEVQLTDPEVAERMVRESGVDMVACSVGSHHGRPSRLDLERLRAIADAVKGPLVLHGGSGIPVDDVHEAVGYGVVKINIGAALSRSYVETMRREAPRQATHYPLLHQLRRALREVAREKIRSMRGRAAG